jgi:hypothetical protein
VSAQLAFDGNDRAFYPAVVMTAHHGRNDAMIASVARLYIPDGATVIDATWGHGNFWSRTETARFRLVGSDLLGAYGAMLQADFRQLPIRERSADVVVLDPPYVHATTQARRIHSTYHNNETGIGAHCADIMQLYRLGMTEAFRVLRSGGTCWVKCQDAVEGRQQQWAVIEMHAMALELGYEPHDLFVLVSTHPPVRPGQRQFHARRNHSYLWIFRMRP